MKNLCYVVGPLILLISVPSPVRGQDAWTDEQRRVLASIERLSAATAPNGGGADAYAEVLADEFSRWTTGSDKLTGKDEWVAGIEEWFSDGWRVSNRDQTVVEIAINGDTAHTRRIVTETYLGPDGETSTSRAALAETWIEAEGGWLLSRVNVDVLDVP